MLTTNPPLGKSDLITTRIGYGCWRLAGSEGGARVERETARTAIRTAIEAGVNFFDHADIYGRSECERIFGDALRDMPGMRQRLILATKCGIRPPWDGRQHCYDSSEQHIVASVDGSLLRLGVDYVDLLMIHRPDYLASPLEVVSAFARLHEQGKVRWFGVSNFRPSQLDALQSAMPTAPLIANQIEISLDARQSLDDGSLDQCIAQQIAPLAWSPLAKGRLLGEPQSDRDRVLFEKMDAAAARHGVTRAAIALAWLMKHPAGIVPIIGTLNPARIHEALAADRVHLSREEWYELLIAARGSAIP